MQKIVLEEVGMIHRNFRGEASQFNKDGRRGFSVVIDDAKLAANLLDEGWNVKELENGGWFIPVKVSYRGWYPPKVVVIKPLSESTMELTEGTIAMLDYVRPINIDIQINGSDWENNGNKGISAYLDEMYITIEETALDVKYANLK